MSIVFMNLISYFGKYFELKICKIYWKLMIKFI